MRETDRAPLIRARQWAERGRFFPDRFYQVLSKVWCCLHDTGGGTHPRSLRLRPVPRSCASLLASCPRPDALTTASSAEAAAVEEAIRKTMADMP